MVIKLSKKNGSLVVLQTKKKTIYVFEMAKKNKNHVHWRRGKASPPPGPRSNKYIDFMLSVSNKHIDIL